MSKTVSLPLGKQIADVFGCTVNDLIMDITDKASGGKV